MSQLASIYSPWDGNAEALAADLGENPITVRQWRARGSIPPRYWRRIIEAAGKRGSILSLEQFAQIAEAVGEQVAA